MFRLLRNASTSLRSFCAGAVNRSDFKPVYRFPYIQVLSVVNRLKLYQTILTSTTIPAIAALNQLNVCSFDEVLFAAILGIGGMVPLYGVGFLSHKLIGIIYFDEARNLAKFSYLDFWGRRRDVEIPIKEIVPTADLPTAFTDVLYLKIRQFSSKGTMKLYKQGVLDPLRFNKIFSS